MKTDYQLNASRFLARHKIHVTAQFVDASCPPFCDGKHIHGDKYRVTIARAGRRIQFSYWNSYNDSQAGKEPNAYDILSCASSDLHCPDTLDDFCADYGYNLDSRKAERTFKLCRAQSKRLQRIFDSEEIQSELGDIY